MGQGNKRGFIPPQPAAALSSLDFAAASQAFQRAATAYLNPAPPPRSEAYCIAMWDAVQTTGDRLLSQPANTPAEVAEKVVAYAVLHSDAGFIDQPQTQRLIAANGEDAEKGLLAIYLDLNRTRADFITQAYQPEWDAIVARFEAADSAVEAVYDRDDDAEPTDEQLAALRKARHDLQNTRAPNAQALAYKLARLIQSQFIEDSSDSPANPATISRMLSDDPVEQWVACAYQDALALAGETGPVVTAQPDPFDPVSWLAEMERTTGCVFSVIGKDARIECSPSNDTLPDAVAAFDALPISHQWKVTRHVFLTRTPHEPHVSPAPLSVEAIRETFLNGYLNTFSPADRDAVRAKLEAI